MAPPSITSVYASRLQQQPGEVNSNVPRERNNDHSHSTATTTSAAEVTLPLRQRVASTAAVRAEVDDKGMSLRKF